VAAQLIAAIPSEGSGCLNANTAIFQDIVPQIHQFAPDALILVVTDPPDALADVVRMLGHERVLSTGTSLDTLRFRFHLGKRLNVSASDVEALVLGEHGASEVFLWSSARVGGRKALDLFGESPAPQTVREETRARGSLRQHHGH